MLSDNYIRPDNEKIVANNIVKTLKSICSSHDVCKDCPFYEKYSDLSVENIGRCTITAQSPKYYEVN